MTNFRIIVLVFLALFWSSPGTADCDLSTYDRSPPTAIKSGVNNGIAQFEWSTDVDSFDGRSWVWHYLKNLHPDRGLGYKWPKANLRRSLGSPLGPGKADCNRYFVVSQAAPDDNAPITYGTNEAVQRAAVFSETKTAALAPAAGTGLSAATGGTASIIETSYTSSAGVSENVRVGVFTGQSNGTWYLQVELTPNVTIAMATRFLNADQLNPMIEQFRRQLLKVDAGTLPKTVGGDEKQLLSGLFSENELEGRPNQPYLVFFSGGATKARAVLSSSASGTASTDLIFFDPDRRSFFATSVGLVTPSRTN